MGWGQGPYSLVKMLPARSMRSSAMPQPRTTQVRRVFGHQHRQAGFLGQQAVQVAQECATAGQHHAARSAMSAPSSAASAPARSRTATDLVERFGQGFQHFVGRW